MAGRDESKLQLLASELGVSCGIVVAVVASPASLTSMTARAQVLIDTVGPFRYWGEPVVRACIASRCHYLDICGEPEYIERIELQYNEAAKQAGVYVASAVGFDSVPGDVGTLWSLSLFKPPARCTTIETFLTIRGGPSGFKGHYPTFLSAIEGFASAGQLAALRKRAGQTRGKVNLEVPGPKLARQTGPKYDDRVKAWTFPFMGADASVVKRTMAANQAQGKPAAHCAINVTLPSRFYMLLFVLFGSVFSFLAKKGWGRKLMMKFPGWFSFGMFTHEGPSEQQMKETVFYMTHIAKGYSKGTSVWLIFFITCLFNVQPTHCSFFLF